MPTDNASEETSSVTDNPDGSHTVHGTDGSTTTFDPGGHRTTTVIPGTNGAGPTTIDWDVDLPALQTAITEVGRHADTLTTTLEELRSTFNDAEEGWESPSGQAFRSLNRSFSSVARDLHELLEDALRRMRASYQNYLEAENTNLSMLLR